MKTLRNKILVILVSILFLCLSLSLAFSFNIAKVHATVDNEAFVMDKGASLALTKDGIRFRVKMGQNVYDRIFTNDTDESVDLSVLVAPKTYFDALNDTENAGDYQKLSKKIEIQIDDVNKVYVEDGYYYANAVLTNLAVANSNGKITKDQFDLDFVAVGCIATTSNSETTYEYSSFFDGDMANNVRSQYQVAQAVILDDLDADGELASAVLNSEGPYDSWLGTENYPIKVDSAEEYTALQLKVAAGLETDAQFNVYNKFEISDRENLPENTDIYHYVKFFDGENELETVEVKEGESATESELPEDKEQIDYANSCIWKYRFDCWVTENNSITQVNLNSISNNTNAYAHYAREDITDTLLAEASAANSDVAMFFSERFGFTQFWGAGGSASHAYTATNREYHPNMSYGGIQGMTSYTVYNTGAKDLRMVFNIEIAPNFRYNTGDYVKFYVYSDITTGTTTARTLVRCNNANGIATVCDNNDWAEIVFPAEEFANSTYLSFGAFGTSLASTDVYKYYISNVVRIPASEVNRIDNCTDCTHTNETVASDYTWTVGDGDVEFVGPVNRHHWGTNHSYIGEVDKHVYHIDGRLVYGNKTNPDSSWPARAIGLTFANKMTGKIYFTAKGFAETGIDEYGIGGMRTFSDGVESGSLNWKLFTRVSDFDSNGFAVYEYDLGTTPVAYVRLCAYTQAYRQVIISNISTTNPAA